MNAIPKIGSVTPVAPVTAEEDPSRTADMHRRFIVTYEQRAVDAKRAGKRRLADLAAERKAEKERHAAAIARLDELVAEAKQGTEVAADVNRRLAAASRAAVEHLVE